eukprot:10973649-Lingulodinium_polyedra.AAC.1
MAILENSGSDTLLLTCLKAWEWCLLGVAEEVPTPRARQKRPHSNGATEVSKKTPVCTGGSGATSVQQAASPASAEVSTEQLQKAAGEPVPNPSTPVAESSDPAPDGEGEPELPEEPE